MKNSKHQEIKIHLLNGKSLTGLEAIQLFNVYRLSSVINRLRNEGIPIETKMIQREDGTTYAKYYIKKVLA